MHKAITDKFHRLLSLLLLAVIVSSILIKPAHILLLHHDHALIIHSQSDQKNFSILHDYDCAICDFEFCSFIPQKQVIVPQVDIISTNELASRMVACFISNSSHNFQLRAPPEF